MSKRIAVLIILLAVVALAACSAQPEQESPRSITVEAVTGSPMVTPAGDENPRPLTAGETLTGGERINTGDGTAVLRLEDGTQVYLSADTTVTLQELAGTPEQPITRYLLNVGAVFATRDGLAPYTGDASLEMQTPHAIAAIRGSSMGVITGAGGTDVICSTGTCEVTAGDKPPVPMTQDTRIAVNPSGAAGPVEPATDEDRGFVDSARSALRNQGQPPTPEPTETTPPTAESTATALPRASNTPRPTSTSRPTNTPRPTLTATPTVFIPRVTSTPAGETTPTPETSWTGSYGVSVTGSVRWWNDPVPGATVVIKEPGGYYGNPVLAQATVDASGNFTISNPPAGDLYIYAVAPSAEYWDWTGYSITIPVNGSANAGIFHLSKRIVLLSPADNGTASTSPTLTWEAFPGTSYYHIDVFDTRDGTAVMRADTASTSITVTPPLVSGVRYEWSVNAITSDNITIAYYSSWYFTAQ